MVKDPMMTQRQPRFAQCPYQTKEKIQSHTPSQKKKKCGTLNEEIKYQDMEMLQKKQAPIFFY